MPFDPTNLEGRDRIGHIEEYLSTSKVENLSRTQIRNAKLGFITESGDRQAFTNTQVLTSRTLYLLSIGLRKGDTVSTINTAVFAGITSASVVKSGIYNSSLQLVASTADSSATFAWVNQMASFGLSASYVAPADDLYYVGHLQKAGTAATLVRGSASTVTLASLATSVGLNNLVLAIPTQDDLPSTVSSAAISPSSAITLWFAVS